MRSHRQSSDGAMIQAILLERWRFEFCEKIHPQLLIPLYHVLCPNQQNSRKTVKKWYDYFDQETMDLTYEMYKMDFEVFGYDTAIKERPDLKPPRTDRRTQLGAMKMTGGSWSRNSLINSSGMRISQANLFGSVKSSMRKEMFRRSSTTALKNSLVQMNKDEILAQVAGLRHISTVGEEESMDETEHHSNDGRKVYRRSSTSALKRDSDAGSSMSDVDGSVRSKKDE